MTRIVSARDKKIEIAMPDPKEVLALLQALPVPIWKYNDATAEATSDYAGHMGPYADDFQQIFALGDGRTLAFVDVIGVALAGLQGATLRIAELEDRVAKLDTARAEATDVFKEE